MLRAEAARQRGQQAARRVSTLRDEQADGGRGLQTAAERALAAAQTLAVAHAHAIQALDRSAEAHRASALAHERAADTAETLGKADIAARHRDGAAVARKAAELDRHAAAEQRQRDRHALPA